MRLYSNAFNSAGERVRIACALKRIDYEYVSIQDIGWDAYIQINPQGLLPTLQVDGALIVQSTAILEYIEERFPTPALLPEAPIARAQARAVAQVVACEMHAVDVLRTRKYLANDLNVSKPGIELWTDYWFEKGAQTIERLLEQRTMHTDFAFGNQPGWADLYLALQLRKSVQRYFQDLSSYPLIDGIYRRCMAHPAFIEAAPEQQSDFERASAKITVRGKNDDPPPNI